MMQTAIPSLRIMMAGTGVLQFIMGSKLLWGLVFPTFTRFYHCQSNRKGKA